MKKEQVFSPEIKSNKHCLLHGSMNKSLPEMIEVCRIFNNNGIIVEPDLSREVGSNNQNFIKFKGEEDLNNYDIEGKFLKNLNRGDLNFCYFVNPNGYMGKAATFELASATFLNIPIFFLEQPDLDFYKAPKNSVWDPKDFANYINKYKKLPDQSVEPKEWQELIIPRKVVAVGAVIEWQPRQGNEKEVLLVKTNHWGGRFSIVGKKWVTLKPRKRL